MAKRDADAGHTGDARGTSNVSRENVLVSGAVCMIFRIGLS